MFGFYFIKNRLVVLFIREKRIKNQRKNEKKALKTRKPIIYVSINFITLGDNNIIVNFKRIKYF